MPLRYRITALVAFVIVMAGVIWLANMLFRVWLPVEASFFFAGVGLTAYPWFLLGAKYGSPPARADKPVRPGSGIEGVIIPPPADDLRASRLPRRSQRRIGRILG